jgi:hypothetical protein
MRTVVARRPSSLTPLGGRSEASEATAEGIELLS